MFGAPTRFAGPVANGIGAHYRELDIAARVEGASPHGLIQIMLDEALKAIDTLRAIDRAGGHLPGVQSRTLSILHGLEAGLDFEKGGEIARSLATIYREARRLIGQPQGPARGPGLEQARTMLAEIAAAWSAIG